MKKLLYLVLFALLLLSGCEKKSAEIAPESVFKMDGKATRSGVSVGDGPEEFKKAYGKYIIQVAWNDLESSLMVMSPREIPYDEEISTVIATMFIDGEPVSEEEICEENGIEADGLHALLSSPEYLRRHEVLYRYLDFEWSDGKISRISSEELNYNETFETPYIGS